LRYRLGVVDVTFWGEPEPERDRRAREMGFEHIDVLVDVDPASLVLPIGCPTAYPKPHKLEKKQSKVPQTNTGLRQLIVKVKLSSSYELNGELK
jgi:hypothetical protein